MDDTRLGIETPKGGEMAKKTAEAKAEVDEDLQDDGQAAGGRTAYCGNRRNTADAVGWETVVTAVCKENFTRNCWRNT